MKSMRLSENDIEKILDFIQEHLKYSDRELLKKYIKEHEKYGTFDYAVDSNGNIVAVVRYNMLQGYTLASILDFAIRKDFRKRGVGKDFILRALKRWPEIEKIAFVRGIRGDERTRVINIRGILKRNIF